MEFVDGGQVNDRHYMERNKIDVNEVSPARSAAGGAAWRGQVCPGELSRPGSGACLL